MRGTGVDAPGAVSLPSPGEVARGVVPEEPAPPARPPSSPLDLHVPPAPAVEPPKNPLEGFGRALVDWSKDPYAYQRTLDREEPGRPMLKPVNPLVKPGEPGARDSPMVYIPLAIMKFGGPSRPKHVISDEPVDERDALHRLARRLEAVWGDGTRPAVERRRTLFELWDECQESGAGVVARAQIMGFIRRRLPGSYPAEELRLLNSRRSSREPFAP